MTITELCTILRNELFNTGYEYGFIANGKRYQPDMNNGFDNEYYQNSLTIYHVQDPSVTRKEKIGTCVETVLVIKQILDELDIPCKLWLLHNKTKNNYDVSDVTNAIVISEQPTFLLEKLGV